MAATNSLQEILGVGKIFLSANNPFFHPHICNLTQSPILTYTGAHMDFCIYLTTDWY